MKGRQQTTLDISTPSLSHFYQICLKMSAPEEDREPWAQLVSTTDVDSLPVSINKDRFSIGRRAGDMTFPDNRLVSSTHCTLFRELATGKVFLQDTSTNGTMINNTKVGKGQKWELNHGDEIHIVFKKNNTEQNIAYLFQDLARLKEEEEQDESLLDVTQEYGSDTEEESIIDYTLPNTQMASEASNVSTSGGAKRQMEEVSESEPVSKKHKEETESTGETRQGDSEQNTSSEPGAAVTAAATGGAASISAAQQDTKAPDAAKEGTTVKRGDSQIAGPSTEGGAKDKKPKPPPRDEMEETLLCGVCQDILHDCISLQPCMHSFCAGCYSQWMDMSNLCPSCRNKVDRISKNHIVNNLVQVYLKDHPEKKRSEEDLADLNKKNKITDDMLYPKHGRGRREYESYSDENSDSDSGHEDASLSGGSTPRGWRAYYNPYSTHIMISRPPRTVCRQCPDYVPPTPATTTAPTTGTTAAPPVTTAVAPGVVTMGAEVTLYDPRVLGSGAGSTDTPGAPTPTTTTIPSAPAPVSMGTGITMYDPRVLGSGSTPAASVGSQTTGGAAPSAAPAPGAPVAMTTRTDSTVSSSSQPSQGADISPEERARRLAGERPPPPEPCTFVCQVNQNHVMCQCCWKPMPDRTRETPPSPQQKCTLCHRVFCHLYWGCNNPRCLGCLNKFKDMYFDGRCLNDLINNNHYESTIFSNYLDANSLTLRDVLQECMEKLEQAEFTVIDPNARPTNPITPDTVVCYSCGLRSFRQLAYQYRRIIPRDQLPAEVTSRPDCYWGKNCRTQHSKPHHAKNFSHICEQIRFT